GRSLTYPALRRNAPCLAHSCAIYTRKSSEEGLDQEFNSLQAQREACEAFITSQRHEGWVCLRTRSERSKTNRNALPDRRMIAVNSPSRGAPRDYVAETIRVLPSEMRKWRRASAASAVSAKS